MKLTRKRVAILALVAALVAAGSSWAATTGTAEMIISVESTLASGEAALVTGLSDSFTMSQGATQLVVGVELFQIDLGAASFSDRILIDVLLVNPTDVGGVLTRVPGAYIDVAVWYEDATGDHTLNNGVTKVSKDTTAEARMDRSKADALLQPSIPDVTRYYILASITVLGGNRPPGEQEQLTGLEFWSGVTLLPPND